MLKCPKCKQTESFEIVASNSVGIHITQYDIENEVWEVDDWCLVDGWTWENDSWIMCKKCNNQGIVANFEDE